MFKNLTKVTGLFIFLCTAIFAFSMATYAAPAHPDWQNGAQPDGEKFQYRLHGDEFFNWTESETGEVIEQGQDGYWYFNELKDNKLQRSSNKYSKKLSKKGQLKSSDVYRWKKGLPLTGKDDTSVSLTAQQTEQAVESAYLTTAATTTTFLTHPTAAPNQRALVVLVSFNDMALTYTDAQWNNLFFGTSGSTVRNFYDENSGGKAIFGPVAETSGTVNDGVVRVSLNKNHPGSVNKTDEQCRTDVKALIPEIMGNVNSVINFAALDTNGDAKLSPTELCISIVFAGYEKSYGVFNYPRVWAEASSSPTQIFDGVKLEGTLYTVAGEKHGDHMATIGVFCHEIGHLFGLPDLYDTDGSSKGAGFHSIMGDSWGCLPGQYGGQTPSHFDAYCKIQLKYATPQIANRSDQYTVNSFNYSSGYNVLRINTFDPKQYFLIENRQKNGFDASLKSNYGGIAVWHIDESISNNNNEARKRVDLEEANQGTLGYSQLDTKQEGVFNHYFASGSGYTLFNSTTIPNSKLYNGTDTQFQLNVTSTPGDSMKVMVSAQEIYTDLQATAPVIQSFTSSAKVIRGGSVNVKAVIEGNPSDISKVTFSAFRPGAQQATSIEGVYAGNNTWEITVNPEDYISGEGDCQFNLTVKSNGSSITWRGYPVVVTVDYDAPNVNLALNKTATASAQLSYEPAGNAVNGTVNGSFDIHDKWCTGRGYGRDSWLKVDLGSVMTINRWKVVHEKGSGSSHTDLFTSDFRLQTSNDGVNNWTDVDVVTGNTLGVTDRPVAPFNARYVRLYINTADADNCARIYQFELYNDIITGIAADFDGRNTSQSSGFTRVAGAPHYTNNIYTLRNVTGYVSGTQPECTISTNESFHSGNSALMLSGTDNATDDSYAYYTVYDNVNVKITDNTTLSYWIMPQNQNSRFIGVDLEFDDGSCLRSYTSAVDQNGTSMNPISGRGTVGTWNFIKCNLGQWCNGRTIKKIILAYHQNPGIGQFKAYVDDIVIEEEYPSNYKGFKYDFDGLNLSRPDYFLKVLGVLDYSNTIAYWRNVSGYTSSSTNPTCSLVYNQSYHSGNGALLVEGTDNYQYHQNSYCYFTVFDNVNITVSASTTLSYWLLPVNEFGRFIGVELEFTDGSVLTESGAVDQNGLNMSPRSGRGVIGQWNFITSNIGQQCEGKVIKRILVAYDQQYKNGQFKGYIDDIIIKK